MCKFQLVNKVKNTQLDTHLDEPTLNFGFFGANGCVRMAKK